MWVNNAVEAVVWTGQSLCWNFASDKISNRVSDDVHVYVFAVDRFVGLVYREVDGRP